MRQKNRSRRECRSRALESGAPPFFFSSVREIFCSSSFHEHKCSYTQRKKGLSHKRIQHLATVAPLKGWVYKSSLIGIQSTCYKSTPEEVSVMEQLAEEPSLYMHATWCLDRYLDTLSEKRLNVNVNDCTIFRDSSRTFNSHQ